MISDGYLASDESEQKSEGEVIISWLGNCYTLMVALLKRTKITSCDMNECT